MHPILFDLGPVTIYAYGFCIAIGAILGFIYMYVQGKKQFGLTFDQCNTLFILVVTAGVVGGKLFIIFESPSYYFSHPKTLLSGSGFVFYGSLILAIPTMLWYFKKNNIPTLAMLDVMGVSSCIVHGLGRIGCFMAGCCYGKPTDSIFGVVYTSTVCQAEPLNTPLHPTQLYEATLIFSIMIFLLVLKKYKQFDGQLFLIYLVLYALGRSVLELFRGDLERGFVIGNFLSTSQFISLIMISTAIYFYVKLNRKAKLGRLKKDDHGK
jgi:phosphatidylglycerol:prolipoprotein diacylglycerol transferase